MPRLEIPFTPCPDVACLLHLLLDRLERRSVESPQPGGMQPARSARPVKVSLSEVDLPAYFSQLDPEPRAAANE